MPSVGKVADIPAPQPSAPPRVSEKPPFLGFGLGLRAQHYDEILNGNPPIDWFEVISENYMLPGGQPLRILDQIRERYPVVMHGVSLSIASTAPPTSITCRTCATLPNMSNRNGSPDHLCWTGTCTAAGNPARPAADPLHQRGA